MTNSSIEYLIRVFLISDNTDSQCHISIVSPVALPEVRPDIDANTLLKSSGEYAGLVDSASDWRFMTSDEVATYKAEDDNL